MIEMFLTTAALPAVAVGLLLLLFGHAPEPWRARIQAMVFAGGFVVACCLLSGFPPWPPQGGAASLIYVAIWFAMLSWPAHPGSLVRFLFRGIWITVGAMLVVWGLRGQILDSPVMSRNLVVMGIVTWAMWFSLERSASRSTSHVLTAVTMAMVSITAGSFLFLFKSSVLMCQMMTTLAVLSGAVAIMAWIFPSRLSLHAVFPFLSGFVGICMIAGMFFLDIDPWLAASLAIPYLVLLVKDLFNRHSASALTDAMMTAVVAGLPLAYILYVVKQSSGPLY